LGFIVSVGEEEKNYLVNYTKQGNVIDHVMISYDENAEGWSTTTSYITSQYINVKDELWIEPINVSQYNYQILSDGKFKLKDEVLKFVFEDHNIQAKCIYK